MLKYYNSVGFPYEEPGGKLIPCIINVLEFLYNQEIESNLERYLPTLRPSSVRIIPFLSAYAIDHQPWRVSIWLKPNNEIGHISQEVLMADI